MEHIEYLCSTTFEKQLDIIDSNEFCLRITDIIDRIYYIYVKYIRGKAHVFKFGPTIESSMNHEKESSYSATTSYNYSYNILTGDGKVKNLIDKFINKQNNLIVDVKEVPKEEFFSVNRNLLDFLPSDD